MLNWDSRFNKYTYTTKTIIHRVHHTIHILLLHSECAYFVINCFSEIILSTIAVLTEHLSNIFNHLTRRLPLIIYMFNLFDRIQGLSFTIILVFLCKFEITVVLQLVILLFGRQCILIIFAFAGMQITVHNSLWACGINLFYNTFLG